MLPLEGELWSLIERQIKSVREECPWLFPRRGGRLSSFRKSWDAACEGAGCSGMLFHDLRRTAARNMRRAGLAEPEVMALLGHKTRSMFLRYSIVGESDLRDAAWRAQAFMASERAEVAECGKSVAKSGLGGAAIDLSSGIQGR